MGAIVHDARPLTWLHGPHPPPSRQVPPLGCAMGGRNAPSQGPAEPRGAYNNPPSHRLGGGGSTGHRSAPSAAVSNGSPVTKAGSTLLPCTRAHHSQTRKLPLACPRRAAEKSPGSRRRGGAHDDCAPLHQAAPAPLGRGKRLSRAVDNKLRAH